MPGKKQMSDDVILRTLEDRLATVQRKRLRHLFKDSAVPTFLVDSAGVVFFMNAPMESLVGYAQDVVDDLRSFLGRCIDDPVAREVMFSLFSGTSGDESAATCEISVKCGSGDNRHVQFTVGLLPESFGDGVFMVQGTDITDRNNLDDALRQNRECLEATSDCSSFPIAFLDANLIINRVNSSFANEMGNLPGDLTGKKYGDCFPGCEREAIFRTVLETGIAHTSPNEPYAPGYVVGRAEDCSVYPLKDAGGRIDGLMFFLPPLPSDPVSWTTDTDIKESLAGLSEDSNEVFFIRDIHSNKIIYVSPSYETVWGLSCRSLYESPRSFMTVVHADDRERVAGLWKREPPYVDVVATFRIVREDDSIRWIRSESFPIWNSDGSVTRFGGYTVDITELTDTKRRLQDAHKELKNRASNLNEANAALKVLIDHQDTEKRKMEQHYLAGIKTLVAPYVEKLERSTGEDDQQVYLDILAKNVDRLLEAATDYSLNEYERLTPTELQIAELIRDGKATKDIAAILAMSENAVYFHRKNIRTKLGIKSSGRNLRSYLLSMRTKDTKSS